MSEERFVELVTKELSQDLTGRERNELQLLKVDPVFSERYNLLKIYLQENHTDRSSDAEMFSFIREAIFADDEPAIKRTGSNRKIVYQSVAAIAVFLLVGLSVLVYQRKQSPARQWVTTSRASTRVLVLSDGTKVTLNAATRLQYPQQFGKKSREVTLVGEAYFDVVKDTGRPFIIHTQKMNVRVLGTAFNVKSYPEDRCSETTLIRGSVEITLKDRPGDKVTLKPSEKFVVNNVRSKAGGKTGLSNNDALTIITHLHKADTTILETSWLHQTLAFKDERLEDISRVLERTYNLQIVFQHDKQKNLKYTGTFEKKSAREILSALSLVEPFTYTIHGNRIFIQ